MTAAADLVGQRFGRLTVESRSSNSKKGKTAWNCRCDCGRLRVAYATDLKRGYSKQCKPCAEKARTLTWFRNKRAAQDASRTSET